MTKAYAVYGKHGKRENVVFGRRGTRAIFGTMGEAEWVKKQYEKVLPELEKAGHLRKKVRLSIRGY